LPTEACDLTSTGDQVNQIQEALAGGPERHLGRTHD